MSAQPPGEHDAPLLLLARALIASPIDSIAARQFIEHATFAAPGELASTLDRSIAEDFLGLPPWARNLLFRLACLQSPDDAGLRRRAASDLRAFGPDWDGEADRLDGEAERIEQRAASS